jgi:diguanylate cyclase (GGDEF)-like protein
MHTAEGSCEGIPQDTLLIVEDSKTMSALIARIVKSELNLDATVCESYHAARTHLGSCSGNYFAALLDLNLPDAPQGEIVDLVVGMGIPAIVFTGELSDEMRDTMWSKRIVDYVVKENQDNVQQVVSIVKRLQSNLGQKVVVADDSSMSRKLIRSLLEVWNFTVLEAADGQEALDIINQHGDITLLLTDYNMPRMDGLALIKAVRRKYSKSRLPVIGLSGVGGATISAHFIKSGANDYMHKPFLTEELYCRVISNIETAEYIATIRNMAERDALTGLYNRRSFFSFGSKLFSSHQRGQTTLTLAMLDIDHFKRCNDTYGHDAGDAVIRFVADTLAARFRETDLAARIGGEEFCIACVNLDESRIPGIFDELRTSIEQAVVHYPPHEIRVTVSIGVCAKSANSLEAMLKMADEQLYLAKNGGRNQVRVAE